LGLKEVDSSVAETVRAVGALNRDGKFAEALAAMQKLPPPVLANRLVGRLQILLATKADDQKAYRELLARFSSNLKDNPSDAFLLIDHYYFQNDYAAALRSIDIVERHVGRDGVMQLLRSSTLFLKGDYRECLAKASDAIRIEPDLQEPYTIAAKCHTGLKEFREAIAMLQSLEQKFNLRISREALAQDPHFADLVNSSEFKGHFGTGEKL
jgi:tetratricopeptide (TPR) repeat protein